MLAGCLRGSVDVRVDDTGAGTVVIEAVPDSDLQDLLEDADVASLVAEPAGSSGLDVSTVEVDGRPGYRIEFSFDDAAALGEALTAGLVIGGQQITLFQDFSLREVDYGFWRLDATVNPAGALLSTPAGSDEALLALAQQFASRAGSVQTELSISLPGRITSTNADSSSGSAATWDLANSNEPTTLRIQTQPAPPLSTVQIVLIGCAVAVVGGLLFLAFGSNLRYRGRRRRSKRAAKRDRKQAGKEQAAPAWAPPPGSAAPPLTSAGQPVSTGHSGPHDPGQGASTDPIPPLPTLTPPAAPSPPPLPPQYRADDD